MVNPDIHAATGRECKGVGAGQQRASAGAAGERDLAGVDATGKDLDKRRDPVVFTIRKPWPSKKSKRRSLIDLSIYGWTCAGEQEARVIEAAKVTNDPEEAVARV